MKYLTASTIFRIIAAGMLAMAPLKQPYDYYIMLKWIVCFVAGYLIYVALKPLQPAWIFIALALIAIFNPIKSPGLSRDTWLTVDIISALVLLVSIFFVGEKIKSAASV